MHSPKQLKWQRRVSVNLIFRCQSRKFKHIVKNKGLLTDKIIFGSRENAMYTYGNCECTFGKEHVFMCSTTQISPPKFSLFFFSFFLLLSSMPTPTVSPSWSIIPGTKIVRYLHTAKHRCGGTNSALWVHLAFGGSLQTFRCSSKAFTNLLRFAIFH